MKAAGIRFPNTWIPANDFPKYPCQKATQTDGARRISPVTPQPQAGDFATPPSLQRARSSSVGSPLLSSTQEAVRNLFNTSSKKAKEAEEITTSKHRERNVVEEGRQLYRELLDQDAADAAEHAENKKKGRYHFCPKMNWEYHNSSEYWEHRRKFEEEEGIEYDTTASLGLTDTSCTSTCACAKSKTEATSTSAAETSLASDSSHFNSFRTPQSSFLHVDSASRGHGEAQVKKADKVMEGEGTVVASSAQPSGNEADNPLEASSSTQSGGPPSTAFEPNHYTQISPGLRTMQHLAEVNQNNAPLDVSLLPENLSVLCYSPTKGVSFRTHDDPLQSPESLPPDAGSPKRPPPSPKTHSQPKRQASEAKASEAKKK